MNAVGRRRGQGRRPAGPRHRGWGGPRAGGLNSGPASPSHGKRIRPFASVSRRLDWREHIVILHFSRLQEQALQKVGRQLGGDMQAVDGRIIQLIVDVFLAAEGARHA